MSISRRSIVLTLIGSAILFASNSGDRRHMVSGSNGSDLGLSHLHISRESTQA